jgi:hypothetical protein
MTSSHFHPEIARQRHSELVRRAEQERLARQVPGGHGGIVLSVVQRLRKAAGGRTATQLEPRHT